MQRAAPRTWAESHSCSDRHERLWRHRQRMPRLEAWRLQHPGAATARGVRVRGAAARGRRPALAPPTGTAGRPVSAVEQGRARPRHRSATAALRSARARAGAARLLHVPCGARSSSPPWPPGVGSSGFWLRSALGDPLSCSAPTGWLQCGGPARPSCRFLAFQPQALLVSILLCAQLGLICANVLTVEEIRWRRHHPGQAPPKRGQPGWDEYAPYDLGSSWRCLVGFVRSARGCGGSTAGVGLRLRQGDKAV